MALDEQKRTKLMLAIMLILILIVVMRLTKKSSGSSSVLDAITGGDIEKLVKNYEDAVQHRDITLQEREDLIELEEELINKRTEFWSYTKSGSPRGDIQQHLTNLGRNNGLENLIVRTGLERTVPGCEYLKQIDFTARCSNFEMKHITEFLDRIDREAVNYYWNSCKIYTSGRNLTFNGSIRVYVLSKKAVSLFGEKS